MLKLTYLIKRRPDLSIADFRRIWRASHGPLVAGLADVTGAVRYTRSLPVETPYNECFRQARSLAHPAHDGVIEIWWPDLETYSDGVGSPAGIEATDRMAASERSFIDLAASSAFLTEEEEVFDLTGSHSKLKLSNDQTFANLIEEPVSP